MPTNATVVTDVLLTENALAFIESMDDFAAKNAFHWFDATKIHISLLVKHPSRP